MQQIKPTVLCVDDHEDSLELLEIIFEMEGFEVKTCDSLENCLQLIYETEFSAIVMDQRFGRETSLELCSKIRAHYPSMPIIYYSAEVRKTEIEKTFEAGATAYLTKPDDFGNLTETVKKFVQLTQSEV